MAKESFGARLAHGWNAFRSVEKKTEEKIQYGTFGSSTVHRSSSSSRRNSASARSIIASIYARLAVDVASYDILHVRLDEQNRYKETMNSGLNNCLTVEANIDQAASHFRQDIALSMFEHGNIAIVPIDTDEVKNRPGSVDIRTMRIGPITAWFARHVTVSLWDDETGTRRELTVPKSQIAIVENPFYTVMNETNSTLQRLIHKLGMLDSIDEASSSGKLDLIIQLPYVIKSDARKAQAEQRRQDIEDQMTGSKYGIAYTDGTEKITQLNRPADNNMLEQVKLLRSQLHTELGLTEEVFNGTADQATMVNYLNGTIEPILRAITEAMHRSFLTKTARSQKQAVKYFRDPFRNVTLAEFAELADKLTRSEVASSNELRSGIGMKPVDDPKADALRNTNLPVADAPPSIPTNEESEGVGQNGS